MIMSHVIQWYDFLLMTMRENILYAHPSSLGSGQKMWNKKYRCQKRSVTVDRIMIWNVYNSNTNSSMAYFVFTFSLVKLNCCFKKSNLRDISVLKIKYTHLPLLLPLPHLLHRVSLPPVNEFPPVSEVPAVCSRKPGQQHRGKVKETEHGRSPISHDIRRGAESVHTFQLVFRPPTHFPFCNSILVPDVNFCSDLKTLICVHNDASSQWLGNMTHLN